MATQAIVTLERLRCIRESDSSGSSHSEPYVWPAMGIVTSNSFELTPKVALLSDSRSVVKNEMRAGDAAPIPYPGNTLTANFDDSQTGRQLLLIVALWEEDSTPSGAVQAGYQAYLDELHVAVGSNLLRLDAADDDEQKVIIEEIKKRVYEKVYAAEENELSTWEKTKVYLGWLNVDDFMGADFKRFATLDPTSFTLKVFGAAGDLIVGNLFGGHPTAVNPPIEYEIDGNLSVIEGTVDPCQVEVDGVKAAEAGVKAVERAIARLQSQLHRSGPAEKAGMISQIKDLTDVQLPAAKARLDTAQAALKRCLIQSASGPTDTPIVIG
jgi:hypothetical protein